MRVLPLGDLRNKMSFSRLWIHKGYSQQCTNISLSQFSSHIIKKLTCL